MDRAGLEPVPGEAGVGAPLAPRLATELTHLGAAEGEGADEAHMDGFLRRRRRWQLERSELHGDWDSPLAVADADLEDDFGDFCGRRVA
jgi:hypothetical protein